MTIGTPNTSLFSSSTVATSAKYIFGKSGISDTLMTLVAIFLLPLASTASTVRL